MITVSRKIDVISWTNWVDVTGHLSAVFPINSLRDDKNMSSMKVVQFSRPLTPPCLSTSKVLPPQLTLDVQFQTTPPLHPTSPIDNKSIKGKHNPRMTITCYSFRSAFVFIINLLILSGFLTIFSFIRSLTICFFVALCCSLCSFPKISRISFMIYILVPLLRSTSFIYRI